MEYLKNEEKKKFEKSMIKATIAGVSIATLITTVAICYKVNKENNFTRVVSENGEYELDGFISYNNLSSYKVVEIEAITGERKMYIAKGEQYLKKNSEYHDYSDIYSGEIIGVDTSIVEDDTVISAVDVKEFLIAYDMIKAKYSEDDIENLLDKINEDYKNNENIKLVKTKDK